MAKKSRDGPRDASKRGKMPWVSDAMAQEEITPGPELGGAREEEVMSAIDLVVFDMAGTTIEYGDEGASAFKFALQKNEIPATRDAMQERIGKARHTHILFERGGAAQTDQSRVRPTRLKGIRRRVGCSRRARHRRRQNMGYFNLGSVLVGLVIPFVAVVGGVAVLGPSQSLVLGIPVVYFWVFLWFVLTSVCLAASWYFFDRKYYENAENPGETEEREETP
jgi:Protein of unknown function (DUF3311)